MVGSWGHCWVAEKRDIEEADSAGLGDLVMDDKEGGAGFWLVQVGGRWSYFLGWGPGGAAGLGEIVCPVWICETSKLRC